MITKIVIGLIALSIGFLIGVFYRGRLEPKSSGFITIDPDEKQAYIAFNDEKSFEDMRNQSYVRFKTEVPK